ncbi:MAG TPA: DUF3322 domain-containing protein, partial [Propionicimonas sp.]
MAALVRVVDVRARARTLWEREGRRWAAGDSSTAVLDIPLHPPTERDVLADYAGSIAWVQAWRDAAGADIEVTWEDRRWGRVGTQAVPTRVCVRGPDAITAVAGTSVQWRRWRARSIELVSTLGNSEALLVSLVTHARVIGELDSSDFRRLRDVAAWLRANPSSGRFVRQLPIRGIDSKWLERHRAVVEALVGGQGLGLRQPPVLTRVRFLDQALAPGGVTDLTAPPAQLDALTVRPERVVIVENLQSFLALPDRAGVIAIDGRGNVAPQLAAIGWIRDAEAVYWGDLDSHGLRILSQARGAGLSLTSCLMDQETLMAYRDLWVVEPQPYRGALTHLTEPEQAVLAA